MEMSQNTMELLERGAKEISSRYDYSYDDAASALQRSYKYYVDIGEDEEPAAEDARTMVAEAVFLAPRLGFEHLRGTIDHMLFSIFHRVPHLR